MTGEPGSSATSLTGQLLADGKYEIGELIGEGGMGTVYKARHLSLHRTVAIKVMHREILMRPKAAARFEREARAASQLNHRNSVQVLDFGEERGMYYIVMEYVDGYDLGDVIHADGILSETRASRIMVQVCAALARAHDAGVIHRDLKPDNVVLTEGRDDDGHATELVKVCDFGIAKIQWGEPGERSATITEAGDITGTPHFMSPEQCQALEMDARSDIYSCGVILYNMVTGDVPFDAPTPVNIMVMHVAHAPKPPREMNPGVSEEMERIILQAMSKDPAARQEDARELRRQLVTHLSTLGVGTVALGATTTGQSAPRVVIAPTSGQTTDKAVPVDPSKGRAMVAIAALFALLGFGAAGFGIWMTVGGGGVGNSQPRSPSNAAASTDRAGASPASAADPAGSSVVAAATPGADKPAPANKPDEPDQPVEGAPPAAKPVAAVAGAGVQAVGEVADESAEETADSASPGADTAKSEPEPKSEAAPKPEAAPREDRAAARARAERPAKSQRAESTAPAAKVDEKPPVAAAEPAAKPEPASIAPASPEPAVEPAPKPEPTPPPEIEAKPEPAAPPAPKPAAPASFEATVSLGGVSASGSLPTSAVKKAASRLKSAFASCYSKAARAAGRAPATKVKLKGIIDEDGRGRRFSASGGSLPGLAACVKAAASGIRSRTRPDTGTVDASFEVHFKPKSP